MQTSRTTTLTLMMPPLLAVQVNASMITYKTWSGNRELLMVMDDTGANSTEIYRSAKFAGVGDPTISPPGPDGTWIAIDLYEGLFKVRADGTELTKVFCSPGTDADGEIYYLGGRQQWSPNGTEILVWPNDYLALIPADPAPGPDCASSPVPIPYFASATEQGWEMEGHPAWNDDGSQIAFFESRGAGEETEIRLIVLERQETGDWVPREPLYPTDFPGHHPLHLDWQRGGKVAAFVSREETERRANFWLTLIDTESGSWEFLTENGSRIEGTSPSWSPDGSQLIFNNGGGHLVKWDYPNGPGEVLASGVDYRGDADWQRDPLSITCESGTDCQDGNPCTDDLCDLVSGECSNPPAADGTDCGVDGWCISGFCFEPECGAPGLPLCDDGNACTIDQCSNWECAFDPAPAGQGCDDSDDCTTDDRCDTAGNCIGDLIPGCGCLPKGASCTSDSECCSNKCRGKACR
jgi:hypothetical protein